MQIRLSGVGNGPGRFPERWPASGCLPAGGSPLPCCPLICLHTKPVEASQNQLDLELQESRVKTVLSFKILKTTLNKENKKYTVKYKGHLNLGLDPQTVGMANRARCPWDDQQECTKQRAGGRRRHPIKHHQAWSVLRSEPRD